MYVSRVALVNFRNYAEAGIELPQGLVVFQGLNAQGKSNLLEAVFYLATSRSPRASTDGELIGPHGLDHMAGVTRLSCSVQHQGGGSAIEIVLVAPSQSEFGPSTRAVRKQIKVNGVPRRAVDLLGTFRVALFRPEDLDLAAGPPSGRRRALDILLSQLDRDYARALSRYNRVVLQRNHLLRRIGEGQAGPQDLTVWDEPLLQLGGRLLSARTQAVVGMSRIAGDTYGRVSGEREEMSSAYVSSALSGEGFEAALQAAYRRDVALGQTTVGPHRDDVDFQIDGRSVSAFASRGQQRTAVLAWKLAEGEYLRQQTGEDPVLMWDDVLSELDGQRRQSVLELAGNYTQVLLTTTGVELDEVPIRPAAWFHVHAGRLNPSPSTGKG